MPPGNQNGNLPGNLNGNPPGNLPGNLPDNLAGSSPAAIQAAALLLHTSYPGGHPAGSNPRNYSLPAAAALPVPIAETTRGMKACLKATQS